MRSFFHSKLQKFLMHFVFLVISCLFAKKVFANQWNFDSVSGTEYYVSGYEKCFEEARTSCTSLQAELVMIQTKDVQKFLEELFAKNSYSTGTVITKHSEIIHITFNIGWGLTLSSLEREVWSSNLRPVISDTVLPTTSHRRKISLKGAVLPGCNDPKMGLGSSLRASA